ncbi:MAG: hypothetical protein MPK06_00625 [Alphaproteobacteria bacterium]|nr:hypothetical protein [Alphaproteobacteria bacterium]MDA8003627.1 hypothetical protein [Alphaproteobacteria bacterium]MDA8005042.1 hypothetical protein [Alphaproteobacteria bacterium]MDA8012425.1 hypothetical protein [Alphaproteobacteria bacterium]
MSSPSSPHDDGLEAVAALIEAAGGLRPLAAGLGLSVSTVQGWKLRGKIPPKREDAVRDFAERAGINSEILETALGTARRRGAATRTQTRTRTATRRGATAASVVVVDESEPGTTTTGTETETATTTGTETATVAVNESESETTTAAQETVTVSPSPSSSSPSSSRSRSRSRSPSSSPGGDGRASAARRVITWSAAFALLAAIVWTWLDVFRDYRIGWERPSAPVAEETTAELQGRVRPALRTLPEPPPRAESRSAETEAALAEAAALRAEELAAVRALEARLLLLEEQLEDLTLSARAFSRLEAGLDARLEEIEELARRRPDEAAVRALAILQLRHAVDSGRPYREALDVVLRLSGGGGGDGEAGGVAALVSALGTRADAGIAPRARLRAEFAMLRARVESDWLREQGWWGRVLSRLPGDLRFSRLGGGEGLLGRLGRAEAALTADAFGEALVALEGLGGVAGGVLAPWQEEMRVRLAAEAALLSFETALLGDLAAVRGLNP